MGQVVKVKSNSTNSLLKRSSKYVLMYIFLFPLQPFNIDDYNTAEELECLGLEPLKEHLKALGLKCGGNLQERAQRLFATKGKALEDLDPSLFAKPSKGKSKKK
jgi:hypothetical protein